MYQNNSECTGRSLMYLHLNSNGSFSFPGDGQCFITARNCTGANRKLESEEKCCLGNGLSYDNGLTCQICYGKHTNTCEKGGAWA